MNTHDLQPIARRIASLVHRARPDSVMSWVAAFGGRPAKGDRIHTRGRPLEALDDRLLEDIGVSVGPVRRLSLDSLPPGVQR